MTADPCAPVTLHSPDGAVLTVSAYGGQVLGWEPSPGDQRLYLSPLSQCGDGAAQRGGVPVIFPQFSGRGSLPKHGFARDRVWQSEPVEDAEAAVWRAWLEHDDVTLSIWPHPFRLALTARASASALTVALEVANTGDQPWPFAAALHNYLTVGSDRAALAGLGDHPLEQNAAPGEISEPDGDRANWPAQEPRDVRILDVSQSISLLDPPRSPLRLSAGGFPDRVIWNPGPNSGIGDLPDGAERAFVCIEPALVAPVELAGGQVWAGQQTFTIG